MRIPATPRRTPAKHDNTRMKPAKKYRKIFSKSGLEASPEAPESLQDPFGMRPSTENAINRFTNASDQLVIFAGIGFDVILGPGREPKIH